MWGYLSAGSVVVAIYLALPDSPVRTALWMLVGVSPVLAIGLGVRTFEPAHRMPWLLIAAGQLSFAIGDAYYYWRVQVLGQDVPVPSLADAFYLGMYPLLAGGLLAMVRRRNPGGDRAGLLDGLIITIGVGLLIWVYVISSYVHADAMDVGPRLTSMAYPIGDTLVIAVFARLWSDRGRRGVSFGLLGVAFVALLTTDTVYAWMQLQSDFEINNVLDFGWGACFLGMGAAALHPSMRSIDEPAPAGPVRLTGGRFAVLLAVASLLVPILVSVRATRADLPLFLGASAVLFCLVLARMVGLMRELRRMHLQRGEGRFQRLAEQVTDLITICDQGLVVRYQTASIQRMLGYRPDELTGRSMLSLVHDDDLNRVAALLTGPLHEGQIGPVECRLVHRDGSVIHSETRGRLVDDEDLRGYLFTTRDVTDRKVLEDQLTERVFHDELTGLANRALLADRVQHALERRDTPYRHLAVLVIDIDDFKTVNDSLGRAAGDELLRAVADRLRGCLRIADTAARLGGDEFALLLESLDDAAEAARIAERSLAALRQPVTVHGREISLRASVGIAISDPDRLPNADELLGNADVAMHMAKRQGRNRFAYFAPSMHAGLIQRLDLIADLRGAIERRELTVHYQPLVDLSDGHIVGAEALVRWPHPKHGMVPPDRFIPLAEESGLILPLGYEVLNAACRQAASWRGIRPFSISVNLSPRQVQDPALLLYVQQALAASGLPPHALTLEITESVLGDPELAAHRLGELKALGVRLAVDDFGTGYSSLSRLHEFPIDILKIPKPFVDGVADGPEHSALARAILDLSAALGLRTVAEGIELEAQSTELRRLGCRIGQGYHFARPMPPDQLTDLLVGSLHPSGTAV